jgi:KaiC/GvpD/RAD55 family RecA-like ATPase
MSRVNTTITGLDELIEGGFVENDVILVTGGPGSGKSTFGIQYIVGGIIEFNEPGIYVTLEETPVRVIRNMWRFGWDLERHVRENMLRIIQSNPVQFKDFIKKESHLLATSVNPEGYMLENIIKEIQSMVDEIGAKRLFIDSITSLKISSDESMVRFTIMEMIKNLENLDCTTVISSEVKEDDGTFTVEEYLCEGVIRLHMFRTDGAKERAVEILKMRGVKHDEFLHPYAINENGLEVYPTDSVIIDKGNIINF